MMLYPTPTQVSRKGEGLAVVCRASLLVPPSAECRFAMPSRKRAQGRARKAQTAAPSRGVRDKICRHGFPILNATQQQVMEAFWKDIWLLAENDASESIVKTMCSVHEKHDLLRISENRELIRSSLVWLGTDSLLQKVNKDTELSLAVSFSCVLVYLEDIDFATNDQRDFAEMHSFFHDLMVRHRRLFQGCKQRVVTFYRKRTPCSCLDKMHAELKLQSKTGPCSHCGQQTDWRALRDCSKCNMAQYCSKECQRSDWKGHKSKCQFWTPILGGTPSLTTPAGDDTTAACARAATSGSGSTAQSTTKEEDVGASSKS